MISIEAQQKLLLAASKNLKKKITVYAIGGTAMMFLGLKNSTLDIDLVFETSEEREFFKKAIQGLGYQELNAMKVYGAKKNTPEMFTLGDERFDLFVGEVINFTFSDQVKKRAKEIRQFSDNLIIKIADPHDLIIMKCATDRLKDKDDVMAILKNTNINWDIVVAEAKNQVKSGKETATFELGYFLKEIYKTDKKLVPMTVLDCLFDFVKEQAEEQKKRK
ncbi:hypothetical protein HZA97_05760 [Candidatus Woesearchaeota archaeon]|nr:hypothetical protein [Candidatus Woesearchaeota archaeon]